MTDTFGLPRELDDGLMLRWATVDDVEELANFNAAIHGRPDEPNEAARHWTRDMMSGRHPTTRAGDFTVVVDQNAGGKIVSSMNLISQTWTYDGLPFPVGRPELVSTDPAYRRRGLVREQFEVIHAKSAARGELITAITGIPWYYRQFGYEMAMNLGGSRQFFWARPGNDERIEDEPYRTRPATPDDIPVLAELYADYCAGSLVARPRDEAMWLYEMTVAHPESDNALAATMIETVEGEVVAYFEYHQWGTGFGVTEIGVRRGHSWRAVVLFLTRLMKQKADELNKTREKPITNISFFLGEASPVYDALGRQLEKQIRPYAWYLRAPDLPAFLRHITPVLERRLAGSVMAGHSGALRLNLFREQIALVWERGRLREVGTFERRYLADGDAIFPDLTFLQLLFGYRSFEELCENYADCSADDAGAAVLLNILFPRRPSDFSPV